MSNDEIRELTKTINDLSINVAVLTQRIDTMDKISSNGIRQHITKAVINVVVLSLASLVWLGFMAKVIQDTGINLNPPVVAAEKDK